MTFGRYRTRKFLNAGYAKKNVGTYHAVAVTEGFAISATEKDFVVVIPYLLQMKTSIIAVHIWVMDLKWTMKFQNATFVTKIPIIYRVVVAICESVHLVTTMVFAAIALKTNVDLAGNLHLYPDDLKVILTIIGTTKANVH